MYGVNLELNSNPRRRQLCGIPRNSTASLATVTARALLAILARVALVAPVYSVAVVASSGAGSLGTGTKAPVGVFTLGRVGAVASFTLAPVVSSVRVVRVVSVRVAAGVAALFTL